VPRTEIDPVVSALVAGAGKLKGAQGHGLAKGTRIGPLVSEGHMQRVLDYIERGRSEGAELVAGGVRNEEAGPGYYVEPTIFLGSDEHSITREEIFGPVLTVLPFEDLEDVVRRANTTEYGLAAGVWTRDLKKGVKVAHALRAGTVWINGYLLFDAAAAWGGFKQSGIGREMGRYALEAYTEVKTIWVNLE
jgi:aldehyde dehydrogenase (NAD+)/phenylacetaldehyde dehydrogenase